MKRPLRRDLIAVLAVLAAVAVPASAVVIDAPAAIPLEVPVATALSAAPMAGAAALALPLSDAALSAAPALGAVPIAAAPSAVPAAAVASVASPAAAAPALDAGLPAPAAATRARPTQAPASALADLDAAAAARDRGSRAFDGGRAAAPAVAFVKNDEGALIGGRTADQYREIRRLYAKLSPLMDLSDTMNVMDDAYAEARVKLLAVERAAAERKVEQSSVHLEDTRTFIDAVLEDPQGRNIAVHTHRVYFHPAGEPESEINEGIRRVDSYLTEAQEDFGRGGRAEREMGMQFDRVVLSFDTRGYKAIEDHLRAKEAEIRARHGDRFQFAYVTEAPPSREKVRADYNRLVEKYKSQPKGVMNIIDGVTYSRYVGLLHELKSHEDSVSRGETVLQAGRDFFEEVPLPDGTTKRRYITEFDAVVRAKDGTIILREDKSVRIPLPLEKVMQTTFLYKLDIYKKNRALIERSLGAPLNVRFSVDVGGADRRAARAGLLVWKDPRQQELLEYLKTQGPILSAKYGFPVSFVFVNSHPNEDPHLFDLAPTDPSQWQASQAGGGRANRRPR